MPRNCPGDATSTTSFNPTSGSNFSFPASLLFPLSFSSHIYPRSLARYHRLDPLGISTLNERDKQHSSSWPRVLWDMALKPWPWMVRR